MPPRGLQLSSRGLGLIRRPPGAVSPVDPPEPIDTTPNAFELGGPFEGEPDEIVRSLTFQITGVTPGVPIPASLSGGHGGCCRFEEWDGSAWLNIGQTPDLYAGIDYSVRTRAHESPGHSFVLTATAGGVSDTMTVETEAEAPADLPTPILIKTNEPGEQLTYSIGGMVIDEVAGYDWYVEVGGGEEGSPDFDDGPGPETELRVLRRQIIYDDFNGNLHFSVLDDQPNGFVCSRVCIKDDSGRTGPLSNVVTETVAIASEMKFDADPGEKHPNITLSDDDLSMTGNTAFGIAHGVLATRAISGSGVVHFDYTVAAQAGDNTTCIIAVCEPGMTNLSTGHVPGQNDALAVAMVFGAWGWKIVHSGVDEQQTGYGSISVGPGDKVRCSVDFDTGDVAFFADVDGGGFDPVGVPITIYDPADVEAGLRPFAAVWSNTKLTADFSGV